MEFALHIVSGPSAGTKIVVKPGQTVSVGRTDRSRYVIGGDSRMSSLHFQIEASEEEVRIKDLGSTNGTVVNGSRMSEAVLREGDQIIAGDSRFVVRVMRAQPTAEEKAPFEGWPAAAPAAEPRRAEPRQVEAGPVEATPAAGTVAPAAVSPTAWPMQSKPAAAKPAVAVTPPAAAPMGSKAENEQAAKSKKPPKPLTPQQQTLLTLLREKYQPLYALLDAARDPKIVALLRQSKEQYQSLYEGPQAEKLALFAPYLVRLGPDSPLLEALVREGWGNSWGVYLTCQADFSALRRHLCHFLKATLPDGRVVSFRFYDPRVLRVYLPSCNEQEATRFFGPIIRYALEDEGSKTLLEFAQQTGRLWLRTADLVTGEVRAPIAQATPLTPEPRTSEQGPGRTLRIRPAQTATFQEAARQAFENRMLAHLKEHFPEMHDGLKDEGTRDLIRHGINRSKSYRITGKRDVCHYIDVMAVLGRDFDADEGIPWARAILTDLKVSNPSAKIQRLCAVVLRKQAESGA